MLIMNIVPVHGGPSRWVRDRLVYLVCLVAVLLVAVALIAAEPPVVLPPGAEGAQVRFIQALERLEAEYRQERDRLNDLYERELGALEASRQAAGSLDGVIYLQAERNRFAATRSVTETDKTGQLTELDDLQALYIEARRSGTFLENALAVQQLIDRYRAGLERLMRDLVQRGQIEDAQQLRQEIARLETLPALREANRLTAHHNARAAQPTPAPELQVNWGNGVYRHGAEPSIEASELNVRHTAHSRAVAHRARIQLFLREESHLTHQSRTHYAHWIYGEIAHYPRMILRPSPRETLTAGVAVIQYFANPLAESARFVLMRTEHIPLPRIANGQVVVIDGAGVRYGLDEHRSMSRHVHDRMRGHRHSGLIVSIYDQGGQLFAQASDSLSLADMAASSVPPPHNDVRGEIYHHLLHH